MSDKPQTWTTASIEAVPRPTQGADLPGLVLLFSRLHPQLPAALPLTASPTTLGREGDNTLSIPEAAVSRYHARVELRVTPDGAEHWWVVDMGSTNGTIVNCARVTAHQLVEHDIVRVGDTLFRYASRNVYSYAAYRLEGEVIAQDRPFEHVREGTNLIGGFQMDAVLDRLQKVAETPLSVVVHGESGTGKELVARALHTRSGRPGPFQAINCAALPENLIESELFGHKKGAFTGATADKVGLVKAANGGTLFLDEVGDMPLEAQAKLLRVLQQREVTPIGSTQAEPVDVRVVCATHRDLDQSVAGGTFRGDLLARLREAQCTVPPLRYRREDILSLVQHFLRASGSPNTEVSFSYMLAVLQYDWPYNVRELESAVRLSLALAGGQPLDLQHLPEPVQRSLERYGDEARGQASPASLAPPSGATYQNQPAPGRAADPDLAQPAQGRGAPDEAELRAALRAHKGNIAAVGRAFGKERMQVHRWLRKYGIDVAEYR